MPFQKRCCSECLHFKAAPMGGTGWCEHPKIKLSDGVKLLVRGSELRCRNNWDQDLWESNARAPAAPAALNPSTRLEPVAEFPRDDQVTAVSPAGPLRDTGQGQTRNADLGRQASSPRANTAGTSRQLDPNTAANDDQHDRVRAMHRGPGDALREARQRSLRRRQGEERRTRELVPPIVSLDEGSAETSIASRPDIASEPASGDILQSIEPDRVSPGSAAGTQDSQPLENAGAHQAASPDRFELVPEIRADVDISRVRSFLGSAPADESNPRGPEHETSDADETHVRMSTYDDVMRQARAIRERNRTAPQRRAVTAPLIAEYTPAPPEEPAAKPASDPPITWDIDRGELAATFGSRSGRGTGAFDQESTLDAGAGDDVAAYEDPMAYDEEIVPSPEPRKKSWFGGLRRGIRQQYADPDLDQILDQEDERRWSAESPNSDERGSAVHPWDETDVPVGSERAFDDDDDRILDDPDSWDAGATAPVEIERTLSDDEFGWRPDSDEILDSSFNDTYDSADRIISDGFREEFADDHERPRLQLAEEAVEPVLSDRPLTNFDLSNPDGLSAFRQALFNEQAPTNSDQPVRVDSFRRRPRRAARDHVEPYSFEVAKGTADAIPPGLTSRPESPVDVVRPPQEQIVPPRAVERRTPRPTRDMAFDIRDVVRDVDEPEQVYAELAPHLPRSCSTCRDFRPSESGDRGWCTNAWAFDHRQMVNADDMPCRSSIGHWWLPIDEAWLPALAAHAHEEPTPLIDSLMAWIDNRDEIGRRRRREQSEEQLYVREI